jgi:hypothetical protein
MSRCMRVDPVQPVSRMLMPVSSTALIAICNGYEEPILCGIRGRRASLGCASRAACVVRSSTLRKLGRMLMPAPLCAQHVVTGEGEPLKLIRALFAYCMQMPCVSSAVR